jgi:trigger factor
MKATLETVSNLQRKLNIQVPASEVQAAFKNAYVSIQKHVAIKGFRKGKAPLQTVKSLYGDRVKQDVVNDLVQKYYSSALREHALNPVSFPTIEFDNLNEAADFAFTAEFEIRPEIVLKQIEKLQLQKEKFSIGEDFVNNTLEEIRKSRATTAPVEEDRAAQASDVAVIDFKGFLESGELENGSAEGHELELGAKTFIPGFEDGVVGMTIGSEREIKIKFPDDYHVSHLAGQPVKFQVKLNKLLRKELPELSDAFAKEMGGKYESLEDLKKAIKDDYTKREEKRIKDELKERLMKALVEKNPVDVPNSLLAEQKKALIEDLRKRMESQGMVGDQFEDYKQKWDSDFDETAKFMIRSSFLLDKIADLNDLKATEADLESKFDEYAKQTGIDLARVKEFYSDDDRRSRLRYQLTEEKVVDWLISKADLKEVEKADLEKAGN